MRARWVARYSEGARAGLPLATAALILGISFGVIAEPVLGGVAAIVMSAIVLAGAAQFAAVSVLADGGSALAAIVAGVLLNTRFIPMGVAIAPSVHARRIVRTGVALLGAGIALALTPATPPGVPVLAACAAAVVGAWRR